MNLIETINGTIIQSQDLYEIAIHFIHVKKMNGCSEPTLAITRHDMSMLSPKHRLALQIIEEYKKY